MEVSRPGHRYSTAAGSKRLLVWDLRGEGMANKSFGIKMNLQAGSCPCTSDVHLSGLDSKGCKAFCKVREQLEPCINGDQQSLWLLTEHRETWNMQMLKEGGRHGNVRLPGKPPVRRFMGTQQAREASHELKRFLEAKHWHIWHTSCKQHLLEILIPLKQRSGVSKGPHPPGCSSGKWDVANPFLQGRFKTRSLTKRLVPERERWPDRQQGRVRFCWKETAEQPPRAGRIKQARSQRHRAPHDGTPACTAPTTRPSTQPNVQHTESLSTWGIKIQHQTAGSQNLASCTLN